MKFGKLAIMLFVVTTSIGCDQATKVLARRHLEGRETMSYLGDTFRLTYVENHGAFLGLGSSLPEGVRTALFVVLVSAFLIGLGVWTFRTKNLSKLALYASALTIGGGIGNLIDRIVFNGGVTDFMNMGIGGLRTGIFNVADVWIMVGVGLFVLAPEFRNKDSADDDSDTEPDDEHEPSEAPAA